ncbi:hypothetical protein ES707_11676 [subsurface metagenome]
MTYKVIFTQRALKDLENIDKELQKKIARKLLQVTIKYII